MKRKMTRKAKEAEEEKKDAVLPPPQIPEQKQPDMDICQSEPKEVLLMRIVTWLRDSHALFDYESRQIQKRNLKIENSCNFLRSKDEVKTVPIDKLGDDDPESRALFSLVKDSDGNYFIDTVKKDNIDNLWLVVRAMKSETRKLSYQLRKSDIVKLGRIQFRVKDIQTEASLLSGTKEYISNDDIKDVGSIITKNEEIPENADSSTIAMCRFCWITECCEENPLINICVCTGTMKYIHLECLKRWVKSKVKPITAEKMKDCLESFVWKTFECEVCKTKYPYTLKNDKSFYNIFDIDIPNGPYCILESLSIDKNSSRMIFIMKPNREHLEYKVGRGHDSDIRVSDISVSRYHARIKFQEGKFMLEDNTSKFGTLVMIKDKTPITKNHTCAIQSGRTVVTYMLKSLDGVRPLHTACKNQIQLPSNPLFSDKQGSSKPNDINLARISMHRIDDFQMQNIHRDLTPSQEEAERQRQIQFPMVSEDILRQDMEGEEPDNNNQQE